MHLTSRDGATRSAVPLEMPRQVAYLRRSDRLPLRVEIEGGVTLRYPVVEYVRDARLELR